MSCLPVSNSIAVLVPDGLLFYACFHFAQNTGMGNSAAAAAMSQQQQLNAMQQAAKTMGLGAMGAAPGGAAGLLGGVNPLQLAATVSAINNANNLMGSLASRSGLGGQGRGRGEASALAWSACCMTVC